MNAAGEKKITLMFCTYHLLKMKAMHSYNNLQDVGKKSN